jgi:outer membrane lipoprotein SlyB
LPHVIKCKSTFFHQEVFIMNSPITVSTKTPMHPLMVIVSLAIILVCGLSAAALLGWLPSSTGHNPDVVVDSTVPLDKNGKPIVDEAAPAKKVAAPSHPRLAAARSTSQSAQHAATASPAACDACGVIAAVNPVETRGQGTAVGTAGGAIVGGLLGNQVGSGNGRKLATVAGAIGGAMAGNTIEGNMKTSRSYDIVVRFNDGSTRTFHQAEQPNWRSGDKVRIVDGAIRSNG